MNSYESQAIRRMMQMLDESVTERTGGVAQGTAPDYPAYKYACGYIRALHDMVKFLEDLEQDMREGK